MAEAEVIQEDLQERVDEQTGQPIAIGVAEIAADVDHIRHSEAVGDVDPDVLSGGSQGSDPRVSGDCRDRQPKRGRHWFDHRRWNPRPTSD